MKKTFGSVRVLPSKRVQARYTGPDGVRHVAPTTFDTKGDAEAWLAREWTKVQGVKGQTWEPPAVVRAQEVAEASTLFGPYLEEVIERRLANGRIKPTTAGLYRRLARVYLEKFLPLTLKAITTRMVATWHAALSGTPSSRANAYTLLSTVMHEAVQDGLLDATPCRVRAGGAKRSTRRQEDDVLTTEEFRAYIAAAPERFRMPLTVAFWCGLRSGEVRGLRRRDIDLARGELTVAQQVVKLGGKNIIVAGSKTDAGTRVVSIPPHVVTMLADWLTEQPVRGKDALLWGDAPMSGESLRAAAKKAAKAIGRPELRVHSLRHSSATLVAQNGATTSELMARFGWTTPSMATRYSHAMRDRDRDLAARLSEEA
jgi:integrase